MHPPELNAHGPHSDDLVSVATYRVDPSEDQQRDVQYGVSAFLPRSGHSGDSSATIALDSRSQIYRWVTEANMRKE